MERERNVGVSDPRWSRRRFLGTGLGVGAFALAGTTATGCGPSMPPGGGTPRPEWFPTSPASSYQIAGWAARPSVAAGEDVALHLNGLGGNAGAPATLEVWRVGWHDGVGHERYLEPTSVVLGPERPLRTVTDAATGLEEALWPETVRIRTVRDGRPWPSGVYVVRLTGADGRQSLVPVTIRDAATDATVLVVQSHLTWQAYNVYARHLYDGGSAVTFRRPYFFEASKASFGAGEYFWLEHRVVRWLERTGFRPTYIADVDLHTQPVPPSVKAIVLPGHPEYWTQPMREQLEAAMARGVGVLNLAANTMYWRGRMEPWEGGSRYVCYKTESGLPHPDDPLRADPEQATQLYRYTGSAEQQLFGVMFDGWVDAPQYVPGPSCYSYPLTCADVAHPVFAGTGIAAGEVFDGLCAGEVDARVPGYGPVPSSTVAFRAQLPFLVGNRKDPAAPVIAESVLLERPLGPVPSRVFSAGSYGWPYGLDDLGFDGYPYAFANPKIQALTAQILRWSMREL